MDCQTNDFKINNFRVGNYVCYDKYKHPEGKPISNRYKIIGLSDEKEMESWRNPCRKGGQRLLLEGNGLTLDVLISEIKAIPIEKEHTFKGVFRIGDDEDRTIEIQLKYLHELQNLHYYLNACKELDLI